MKENGGSETEPVVDVTPTSSRKVEGTLPIRLFGPDGPQSEVSKVATLMFERPTAELTYPTVCIASGRSWKYTFHAGLTESTASSWLRREGIVTGSSKYSVSSTHPT